MFMARKARKPKRARTPQVPMFEGPGKRYYVNRLRWLVDFLNTDISGLPPGGFLKTFYDFLVFFYSGYVEDEVFREICADTDRDREELKKAQETLVRALYRIRHKEFWLKYPELKNDPDYSWELEEDEDVESTRVWPKGELIPLAYHIRGERLMLLADIRIYKYEDLSENDEIGESLDFEMYTKLYGRDVLGESNAITLGRFSRFCDPNMYGSLSFGLYSFLGKFPLSSIETCLGCRKYILMTAKKEGPFCSPCLKKRSLYRWREKNRPIYNAYQRNLQKGVKTSIRQIRKKQAEETDPDKS
jgi:hypothetical protein